MRVATLARCHSLLHYTVTPRSTSLEHGICSSPACAYAFVTRPGHGSPRRNTGTEEMTPRGARFLCFPFLMHFLLAVKHTGWFSFLVRGRHPMQQWEESTVFRQQDRTYPVRGHFLPFRCASHASCHGNHNPEPHDARESITRPSLPATTFILQIVLPW